MLDTPSWINQWYKYLIFVGLINKLQKLSLSLFDQKNSLSVASQMINVIRCDISVHFDQRICGMQYWDIVLTFCVRSQKRSAQAIINCWKFASGWLNTISYSANQKILQISLKHVKNLYANTVNMNTFLNWR